MASSLYMQLRFDWLSEFVDISNVLAIIPLILNGLIFLIAAIGFIWHGQCILPKLAIHAPGKVEVLEAEVNNGIVLLEQVALAHRLVAECKLVRPLKACKVWNTISASISFTRKSGFGIFSQLNRRGLLNLRRSSYMVRGMTAPGDEKKTSERVEFRENM